jgi:hypothetical protein
MLMVKRFLRLAGWMCYAVGVIIIIMTATSTYGFGIFVGGFVMALPYFAVGRGIIYVAVGPRLNPF